MATWTSIEHQQEKILRFLDQSGLSEEMTCLLAKKLKSREEDDFQDLKILLEYNPRADEYQIRTKVLCLNGELIVWDRYVPVSVINAYA